MIMTQGCVGQPTRGVVLGDVEGPLCVRVLLLIGCCKRVRVTSPEKHMSIDIMRYVSTSSTRGPRAGKAAFAEAN